MVHYRRNKSNTSRALFEIVTPSVIGICVSKVHACPSSTKTSAFAGVAQHDREISSQQYVHVRRVRNSNVGDKYSISVA